MIKKAKNPKRIEMSHDDQNALIERLKNNSLSVDDKDAIVGLFEFNNWLQTNVQEKNITINRLQKVFGFKTEKRNKKKKKKPKDETESGINEDQNTTDSADNESTPDTSESDSTVDEPSNSSNSHSKNNGRLSHDDYPGIEDIIRVYAAYRAGDSCPEDDCGGKLRTVKPGNVIKLTGQSFAKAIKYELEKLRCNLCEKYFTAQLPPGVSEDKYDHKFKANLCVYKHFLAVPSYRLECYQKFVGVPIPDSTQWDKIEEVANAVYPAFCYLEKCAANAALLFGDDTKLRILSVMKENEQENDKKRKGTFTTGIVALYESHKIHLFYSSRQHTGENLSDLLKKRSANLERPLYMCDALSSNMPKGLKAIILNCLVHGRRSFVEIEAFFPEECAYALDIFSQIYKHEQSTKELGLTPIERLAYHKEHSRPLFKSLYRWIFKKFNNNEIEENSSLGKACRYMIRHAKRLTRFLRVVGAPLDNNTVEQSLKMAIRVRKNSLFYATEHGAYVGGLLQSLIHTCIAADQNPIHYLTALQDNNHAMRQNPGAWMPWNYLENIEQLHSSAA